MILYIPTNDAEELYNLLDNWAPLRDRDDDPYKDPWVMDLMYQIRENSQGTIKKQTHSKTICVTEVIEREVNRILKEKGIDV